MPWFKVNSHMLDHPVRVRDSALGAWLRLGCWIATFPQQDDFIPEAVARRFTNATQRRQLVNCGLLVTVEGGYALRRGMNIASSGLTDSFWDVTRDDRRAAIPDRLRQAIYERDEYACVDCGSGDDLTLDHIWPWSKGGPDTLNNLRTLCRSCNSRKGARI